MKLKFSLSLLLLHYSFFTISSEGAKKQYTCSYVECSYIVARGSDLTRHIRKHTGDKLFTCSYEDCSYKSPHSAHLIRHIIGKHPEVKAAASNLDLEKDIQENPVVLDEFLEYLDPTTLLDPTKTKKARP